MLHLTSIVSANNTSDMVAAGSTPTGTLTPDITFVVAPPTKQDLGKRKAETSPSEPSELALQSSKKTKSAMQQLPPDFNVEEFLSELNYTDS